MNKRGHILFGAVALLLTLSVLIPALVRAVQQNMAWTVKHTRSTRSLNLADAGLEKAQLKLATSPGDWQSVKDGVGVAGFRFDVAYKDVSGGSYAVSITSGPGPKQATIISIGLDEKLREQRAIEAVFTEGALEGVAVFGNGGVTVDGNVDIQWGAVVSPTAIAADGRAFPQFWSAGPILTKDTDPNAPNCDGPDCCQWHSFQPSLPSMPAFDLAVYRASAQATGTYYAGSVTWTNFTERTGKTHYIEGNLTVGSPGIDVVGDVVVLGNVTTAAGNFGRGDYDMSVPKKAWKQYCNAWSEYQSFDPGAPASFPGLSSSYQAAAGLVHSTHKLAVKGLFYVGGNMTVGGGGGSTAINGVLVVRGQTTLTSGSHVTVYYDNEVADEIVTIQPKLTRSSWKAILAGWPAGL